jgi:hypothetical protein
MSGQSDVPLFEGYEPVEPVEPVENLSAGQRLTLRQTQDISLGRHPLTGGVLHPQASRRRDSDSPKDDPFTCGSCYFREARRYHGKSYPKCIAYAPSRITHGPASDVRAWWPACTDYSPGSSISPDAARSIPEDFA